MSRAREIAELGAVYDSGALSNRNLIINGAMQVWQRGTSSTSAGYSTVDRYEMSGTSTRSRSTDAPDGFQYSLQQALTAGNANQAEQFIEAANAVQLKGKTTTLSFYAKATGSVEMYLYASTFSSVDDSSSKSFFVSNQTIGNATSSWVRYTVEIDFSAQANVVNGCGILLGFRETASSTATAYITGVQLEVGPEATPFEHRSYGDELARCQRYYQFIGDPTNTTRLTTAFGWTSGLCIPAFLFVEEFRDVPSFSTPDGTQMTIERNGAAVNTTSISGNATSKKGCSLLFYGTVVQNEPYMISIAAGGRLNFDAEL